MGRRSLVLTQINVSGFVGFPWDDLPFLTWEKRSKKDIGGRNGRRGEGKLWLVCQIN